MSFFGTTSSGHRGQRERIRHEMDHRLRTDEHSQFAITGFHHENLTSCPPTPPHRPVRRRRVPRRGGTGGIETRRAAED